MDTIQTRFPNCSHIMVVDFEATCGPGISKTAIEIIEIGAVLVSLHQSSIMIEQAPQFHQYIRPELHPTLTTFCKKLTGISQEQVDKGMVFSEGLNKWTSFTKSHGLDFRSILFAGWSDFDAKQLRKQCAAIKMPCPFVHFLNLQSQFKHVQKHSQYKSITKALQSQNLEFIGREHSAIDDAYNTARLLPFSGCFDPV